MRTRGLLVLLLKSLPQVMSKLFTRVLLNMFVDAVTEAEPASVIPSSSGQPESEMLREVGDREDTETVISSAGER